MNAQEIVSALNGRWLGEYGSARCPCHDDRNPSLSVGSNDEGHLIVHCHAGCDWRDVKDALAREGYIPEFGPTDCQRQPVRRSSKFSTVPSPEINERVKHAVALWGRASDAAGTQVQTYLRGRGIVISPPATIRYLAAAKHSPSGSVLPVMLACIGRWPNAQITGVHRTFLSDHGEGKASVAQNKMMLGSCTGGAVRLAPASEHLVITEGIETGLSVAQASGEAVWCGLSAGGIENLVLPDLPLAQQVTIAADNDDVGIKSANRAAEFWTVQGRQVCVAAPPERNMDFNDLLKGGYHD